ncbi:hypothetical protein [Streptomyces sp. NPDC018833]|uniref:hypothetical protein n=1 Tax=Streptomyces sp. NPDC018833 TaxID=3365053 RepID=UPI0037BBC5F2
MTMLSAVTGCTATADRSDNRAPSSATESKRPPRPVHDPPQKFASDAGTAMPAEATSGRLTVGGTLTAGLPVALHKQFAFVGTPQSVLVTDTGTGKVVRRVPPDGTPLREEAGTTGDLSSAQAPLLVEVDSTPLIVAAFLVKVTGTGTQADHTALEITAIDANKAKTLWRLPVRLPSWSDNSYSGVTSAVVGAFEDTAVVKVADEDHAVSFGIDLAARRALWTREDLSAVAVAGDTMVGVAVEDGVHQRAVGHDVGSGRRKWRGDDSYELEVHAAGPHLVTAQGRDYDSGNGYYRVLDARTGAVKRNLSALVDSVCRYDDKDTVVCGGRRTTEDVAYAMDAKSAAVLWQLPDKRADRIAPDVTTAWHGRVYGTTSKGPVVLDARSGDDVATRPGIAPVVVNESAGLALDDSGDRLMAYPTSG